MIHQSQSTNILTSSCQVAPSLPPHHQVFRLILYNLYQHHSLQNCSQLLPVIRLTFVIFISLVCISFEFNQLCTKPSDPQPV